METFAVLPEIAVKAYLEGCRIQEIPFHYHPRSTGVSKARIAAFGLEYARLLYRLWVYRNAIRHADYDSRAFFSRIPLQRWWQRRRYEIVCDLVGESLSVLDAGCGSSQILRGLPQAVGMDIQMNKLLFMRAPGKLLLRGSLLEIPVADGAFDTVICSQAIEHVPGPERVLDELARCIAPGGALVLGTVDYGSWRWPLIERLYRFARPGGYADEHVTHFTRASLVEGLERRGLAVEAVRFIAGAEIIVKARKPGRLERPGSMVTARMLEGLLACPKDRAALARADAGYVCTACGRTFPVLRNIPDFVSP
jgi:SAM-dependent methyltransferase